MSWLITPEPWLACCDAWSPPKALPITPLTPAAAGPPSSPTRTTGCSPAAPRSSLQYAWQHPLIGHYARTGDGRARRISDFLTQRQLHRTDLYNHIYRHIELEHQLAVTLAPSPSRPTGMVGLALDRSGRDFTITDGALLELSKARVVRTVLGRPEDRTNVGPTAARRTAPANIELATVAASTIERRIVPSSRLHANSGNVIQ